MGTLLKKINHLCKFGIFLCFAPVRLLGGGPSWRIADSV
jgi:hypothetical protein